MKKQDISEGGGKGSHSGDSVIDEKIGIWS